MKSDTEIREDVIRELLWDPLVPDSHAIGVAVRDGAVTLTGRTPAYAEKLAAVRAASRVDGVKAVVDELKVRLSGEPRDDSDIARAIAYILDGNTYIGGQVHARVERGWSRSWAGSSGIISGTKWNGWFARCEASWASPTTSPWFRPSATWALEASVRSRSGVAAPVGDAGVAAVSRCGFLSGRSLTGY